MFAHVTKSIVLYTFHYTENFIHVILQHLPRTEWKVQCHRILDQLNDSTVHFEVYASAVLVPLRSVNIHQKPLVLFWAGVPGRISPSPLWSVDPRYIRPFLRIRYNFLRDTVWHFWYVLLSPVSYSFPSGWVCSRNSFYNRKQKKKKSHNWTLPTRAPGYK